MAIKLYTGLPGAGKSLSLVDQLRSMHEREPGRPVYAFGIPGLREDLAKPCDPRKWEELPDGSIVVIDEVQDVWPSGGRGQAAPEVRALSKHRHRGFDFLISSQQPAYVDSYVRGLVQEHTHLVRRWWGLKVDKYVWQEGQDDVKRPTIRARAQRSTWKFPKQCFDLYRSSSLHTGKRRLPWQYWLMIGAAVLAIPMIWYAVHRVVGLRHISQDAGVAPAAVAGRVPGAVGSAAFGEEKRRWATPAAYVQDHLPRVANQPWSAPVFDQVPVRAQPDLLCVEMEVPATPGHPAWKRCSCYTEQVTPYDLHSLEECRRYAEHGVYNARRPPLGGDRYARDRDQDRSARRGEAGTRSAASGPADPGAWPSAGSALRSSYVPPELSAITH